jgi:hypothetical protein
MMHATKRPNTDAPGTQRGRTARAILAAALLLALAACGQPVANAPAADGAMQVLGLYEFTFEGIGTDAMTASVRRVDAGIDTLAIVGTDTVAGIRLVGLLSQGAGNAPANVPPAAGGSYVWGEFEVANDNELPLTGLTFLGYASATGGLDGTAFSVVEDANATPLPPRNVRPSGQLQLAGTGAPANRRALLELTAPAGFRMSVVAYTEDEIADLNTALSALPFVNTVFPYGFAATSAVASDSSRTIAANGSGRLFLGFKSSDAISRVVWRAVAVIDDRARIAAPQIYNHQLFQGFNDFVQLAGAIEASNPDMGNVEAVVMGTMHDGTRALPAGVSCTDFDFVELPDVRVAGGYAGSATHFWIGGATANTAVTKVTDGAGNCVP